VHLTATILPPDGVLGHLGDALSADLARSDQVDWRHESRWRIHLADFGVVVRGDALQLVERLGERIAELPPPTLRLEEIRPLPTDGDDGVWVGLGGDADALTEFATAIPRVVHELGFVPDRRLYYPGIRLGRVTTTTTVAYLEDLERRLGGYEGPAWTPRAVMFSAEKPSGPNRPPSYDVFQEVAFHGVGAAYDAEGSEAGQPL
jgi:2'-5' RNA ligase